MFPDFGCDHELRSSEGLIVRDSVPVGPRGGHSDDYLDVLSNAGDHGDKIVGGCVASSSLLQRKRLAAGVSGL